MIATKATAKPIAAARIQRGVVGSSSSRGGRIDQAAIRTAAIAKISIAVRFRTHSMSRSWPVSASGKSSAMTMIGHRIQARFVSGPMVSAAAITVAATASTPRFSLVRTRAASSAPAAPPVHTTRSRPPGPKTARAMKAQRMTTQRTCGCIGSPASTKSVAKAAIIPASPSSSRPVRRWAVTPEPRLTPTHIRSTATRLMSVVMSWPNRASRPPKSS